jgi:hypothetical protein
MLFRERVAIYCENHMGHVSTLCGQNVEVLNVKAGGAYGNHCADFIVYLGMI